MSSYPGEGEDWTLEEREELEHAEEDARAGKLSEDPLLPIYKVVLTGGPCAGKTTAMARVSNFLRGRGFRVYTVPEAATLLFSNGATFNDLNTDDKQMRFQANLMKTQFHLEDTFHSLARDCGQPAVLLCDRGSMDGSAYISPDTWNRLLDLWGFNIVTIRDRRYNAVLHMVTAAVGAVEYYSSATNEVRLEDAEEAARLDKKVQEAWVGHPRVLVFENDCDFETKLQRVIDGVASLVGLPNSIRESRKFLLKEFPEDIPVRCEKFDVDKVYLRVLTRHESTAAVSTLGGSADAGEVVGALATAAGAAPAATVTMTPGGTAMTPPPAPPGPPPTTRESSISALGFAMDSAIVATPDGASTSLRDAPTEDPGIYPYAFVRRRKKADGLASYGYTRVTLGPDGKKVETKRIISAWEYKSAVQQQHDPSRRVVRQRRVCFMWRNHFFEIYQYKRPREGLCLLYLQVQRPDEDVMAMLPPWLKVEKEVTHDGAYSAFSVSQRKPGDAPAARVSAAASKAAAALVGATGAAPATPPRAGIDGGAAGTGAGAGAGADAEAEASAEA